MRENEKRGPGRPSEGLESRVAFYCLPEMKASLEREAQKKNITLSDLIRDSLRSHLGL